MAEVKRRRPKIVRLTSVAQCGMEIGKLYRLMRFGELDTIDGQRMAHVLMCMAKCMEAANMQEKLGTGELVVQVMRYSPPTTEDIAKANELHALDIPGVVIEDQEVPKAGEPLLQ